MSIYLFIKNIKKLKKTTVAIKTARKTELIRYANLHEKR